MSTSKRDETKLFSSKQNFESSDLDFNSSNSLLSKEGVFSAYSHKIVPYPLVIPFPIPI